MAGVYRYADDSIQMAKKYAGDWLLTGDLGRMDEEGYVYFKSRDDDVITSGGYRIGPGEIEECLMKHPAVSMVGVVGIPDKVRTEIVKAFVQLRPEIAATQALKADLANFVKTRLAAHEYPREVEFVTVGVGREVSGIGHRDGAVGGEAGATAGYEAAADVADQAVVQGAQDGGGFGAHGCDPNGGRERKDKRTIGQRVRANRRERKHLRAGRHQRSASCQ